ncbi:MAG: hypothetical protein GY849_02125 [Deltaproteobacteria bacterium]|nr:hypothetical protein [Deltaproteobacteria bacterium]
MKKEFIFPETEEQRKFYKAGEERMLKRILFEIQRISLENINTEETKKETNLKGNIDTLINNLYLTQSSVDTTQLLKKHE